MPGRLACGVAVICILIVKELVVDHDDFRGVFAWHCGLELVDDAGDLAARHQDVSLKVKASFFFFFEGGK